MDDEGGGIPEWVVTFGDMMSLLLTFFIMLVSLSEIKQEEKYQALLESIRRQFGFSSALLSMAPGEHKPRNSRLPNLASLGRALRANTMRGGDRVKAPQGENPRVQVVRYGERTTIGTVVYFRPGSAELDRKAQDKLKLLAPQLSGKPQRVEIRGHALPVASDDEDSWNLAYQRAKNVLEFLQQQGLEPYRVRISVAGRFEPSQMKEARKNPALHERVEVFLLDELVTEPAAP